MDKVIKEIGQSIKSGEIGVIPTDTIYGIVCSAFNKKLVAKIYKIKKRNLSKPVIILISKSKDLNLFGVKIDRVIAKKYWPGKVSIILDCNNKKFEYLTRGQKSLAFRIPNNKFLTQVLEITGPIIAPSANLEGQKPAEDIEQAMKYFGKKVDFYVDVGKLKSKPSKIISIKDNKVKVIRK